MRYYCNRQWLARIRCKIRSNPAASMGVGTPYAGGRGQQAPFPPRLPAGLLDLPPGRGHRSPEGPGTSSPRLLPTFAALSFGPSARPLISAMTLVTFRGGVLVFGAPLGKSPASLPRMRSTRPCRRGKRRTDWQRKTPQGRLKSLASASFAASGDLRWRPCSPCCSNGVVIAPATSATG